MTGTLSIVATPIGNLDDITLRALTTLSAADIIFCEDTRVTKRLLERHSIDAQLESLNARTEHDKTPRVLELLDAGQHVAYVSDAGTPGISDPGTFLVNHARAAGHTVEAIAGPSALTAALSIAGVPSSEFLFLGFLPHKKGRQTLLKEIAATSRPVVLYESTHRITKLMAEITEHGGDEKRVCIARELTKMHEELLCGTAAELAAQLEVDPVKQKGEFVVIVSEK